MEKKSIFRQESLERVASPEQLNDYIRVSTPSVWLILGAFFILVTSVIVWSVTGTLPQTMSINGVIGKDNTVVCYIGTDKLESDISGCKAKITPSNAGASGKPVNGTVVDISKTPYSAEEITKTLKNDWIESNIVDSKYAYAVTIRLDEDSAQIPSDTLADVSLITAELKPINFIFN
jgi:hypothetical protein